MTQMTNNHGRPERVLITKASLELAADALGGAIDALEFFEIDEQLRKHCERMLDRLNAAAKGKPYKLQHRAPKGHAIVPKALLTEAISDICDGANEFEDAAGYCTLMSDSESCENHGSGMRSTANKLRRYVR